MTRARRDLRAPTEGALGAVLAEEVTFHSPAL